jgi:3-dehydroquinate dehydratase
MSGENNGSEMSDAEKQVIEMLKQANISAGAPLQVARLNPGASGHTFWILRYVAIEHPSIHSHHLYWIGSERNTFMTKIDEL